MAQPAKLLMQNNRRDMEKLMYKMTAILSLQGILKMG